MKLKMIAIAGLTCGLSACAAPIDPPTSPSGLRNVSPAAVAALPPGISESFLIRDANGCYGIAVEKTEPQRGVALLGADGQQVCDA